MHKIPQFKKLVGLGRNKHGTAVIEFAIIFPILIVLTMMIFDVGRAMFFYTTVNHLAAEGVRYASVHGSGSAISRTEDDVEAYILGRATGLIAEDLTITVTYSPSSSSGREVEVIIQYNQNFFVSSLIEGLLGGDADASITLEGRSLMGML